MKKITVPPPVQILVFNQENKTEELQELTFPDFVMNNALMHRAFGSNIDIIDLAEQLSVRLSTTKTGDVIELDEQLWKVLNAVVNYPEQPYGNVKVARKLLPFMRVIRDAQ